MPGTTDPVSRGLLSPAPPSAEIHLGEKTVWHRAWPGGSKNAIKSTGESVSLLFKKNGLAHLLKHPGTIVLRGLVDSAEGGQDSKYRIRGPLLYAYGLRVVGTPDLGKKY